MDDKPPPLPLFNTKCIVLSLLYRTISDIVVIIFVLGKTPVSFVRYYNQFNWSCSLVDYYVCVCVCVCVLNNLGEP